MMTDIKDVMTKLNLRGFAIVEGIVFIFVVAVIGVGAYLLGQRSQLETAPGAYPSGSQPPLDQSGIGQPGAGQMPPGANVPGMDVGPPVNGPQNDEFHLATSKDGVSWEPGELVAKEASVPDVIVLDRAVGEYAAGDVLGYFVDFSKVTGHGTESVSVVSSSNGGVTWSEKTTITVTNKPNAGAAVDPSLVQLSDGRLRMYFFGSETTLSDPASAAGPHKVYSAISSDGVNFTVEDGVRFADEKLTDPDVVVWEGTWYMYYSVGQSFKLATSTDGLNFQAKNVSGGDLGGVPGAAVWDGQLHVFACGKMGLSTAASADGATFADGSGDIFAGQVQGIVCDPSPARLPAQAGLPDGTYILGYKTRPLSGGGGDQNPGMLPPDQPQQLIQPPEGSSY